MMLMEKPARTRGTIRCPYHSWTYALDGALRATPMIGGPGQGTCASFDPSKHGLKPVRTATWFDAVFVNLSGDAAPFESFIAPVAERWKDFSGAALHHEERDSSFVLDVACNWKLAVENFCEAYHLPWIHPDLNNYSRLEDHYQIAEEAGGYAGQGSTAYRPQLVDNEDAFPTLPGLPARWHGTAEYVALFPNALFGVHADHLFAGTLMPKGPGRTIEHIDIYYFADEALDDSCAELRQANTRQWRGIFEEDRFVVEGMQRGRTSPAYRGGVLSPALEGTTHCFYRWVAKRLMQANQATHAA